MQRCFGRTTLLAFSLAQIGVAARGEPPAGAAPAASTLVDRELPDSGAPDRARFAPLRIEPLPIESAEPLTACEKIQHRSARVFWSGELAPGVSSAAEIELLQGLVWLWKRAGSGRLREERAAWILESATGLELLEWPEAGAGNRSSWHGSIPTRAVGLAHTHPDAIDPRPSVSGAVNDLATAESWQLCMITVHRKGVWWYDPQRDRLDRTQAARWHKPYANAPAGVMTADH